MEEHLSIHIEETTDLQKLEFLYFVSQKISEKKPLSELLNEIMESSKALMNAEASSLLLYDEKDHKLYFNVATGVKGNLIKEYSVEIGEGISGWVAMHRKSLLIEDCYADSRFNPDFDKKSNFKTKSMICVPLIKEDSLLGVMQVINKKDGKIFSKEDLSLFEILASQCAIAIKNHYLTVKQIDNEFLERELKIARDIQQNLLPKSLPPFNDLDIARMIIPAKEVGGDYYNVVKVNENNTLIIVADVSGKSISAALIVSTIDACLNCYLKTHRENFELLSFVKILNQVLIESTTLTKFATCWLGYYNHVKSELTSVNAGHNPPYYFCIEKNHIFPLEKGGILLGTTENHYESEVITLNKGDSMVIYTDGITEAWNSQNVDYGEEKLMRIIEQNKIMDAENVLEQIKFDVKKHVGNAIQNDDMTCIVIKKR